MHRKLRRAGIETDLVVFEGQSHAQYQFNDTLPDTSEALGEVASFFAKHLAKPATTTR